MNKVRKAKHESHRKAHMEKEAKAASAPAAESTADATAAAPKKVTNHAQKKTQHNYRKRVNACWLLFIRHPMIVSMVCSHAQAGKLSGRGRKFTPAHILKKQDEEAKKKPGEVAGDEEGEDVDGSLSLLSVDLLPLSGRSASLPAVRFKEISHV
jgi:hypothetical protein